MERVNQEMLNQFEILYNNIASNQAPGLNPYEISLVLTKAQNELVKNYFNPKGNKYQEGYDESPKRHSDFASLLCTKVLEPVSIEEAVHNRLDYRSLVYLVPKDIFLLLNEQLVEQEATSVDYPMSGTTATELGDIGNILTVVPISYDEYERLMQKPYKYPPKNQFWKLDTGYDYDRECSIVELIGKQAQDCVYHYHIRYIKHPEPIVLMDLNLVDGGDENTVLTIGGLRKENPCKLPKHLHDEIIQRAVEIAKGMWQGDLNSAIQLGQRSE